METHSPDRVTPRAVQRVGMSCHAVDGKQGCGPARTPHRRRVITQVRYSHAVELQDMAAPGRACIRGLSRAHPASRRSRTTESSWASNVEGLEAPLAHPEPGAAEALSARAHHRLRRRPAPCRHVRGGGVTSLYSRASIPARRASASRKRESRWRPSASWSGVSGGNAGRAFI